MDKTFLSLALVTIQGFFYIYHLIYRLYAYKLQTHLPVRPPINSNWSPFTKPGTNRKKLKSGEQNYPKQMLLQSDIVPQKRPNFNS